MQLTLGDTPIVSTGNEGVNIGKFVLAAVQQSEKTLSRKYVLVATETETHEELLLMWGRAMGSLSRIW
jgi:hypothetical protein